MPLKQCFLRIVLSDQLWCCFSNSVAVISISYHTAGVKTFWSVNSFFKADLNVPELMYISEQFMPMPLVLKSHAKILSLSLSSVLSLSISLSLFLSLTLTESTVQSTHESLLDGRGSYLLVLVCDDGVKQNVKLNAAFISYIIYILTCTFRRNRQ